MKNILIQLWNNINIKSLFIKLLKFIINFIDEAQNKNKKEGYKEDNKNEEEINIDNKKVLTPADSYIQLPNDIIAPGPNDNKLNNEINLLYKPTGLSENTVTTNKTDNNSNIGINNLVSSKLHSIEIPESKSGSVYWNKKGDEKNYYIGEPISAEKINIINALEKESKKTKKSKKKK